MDLEAWLEFRRAENDNATAKLICIECGQAAQGNVSIIDDNGVEQEICDRCHEKMSADDE